MNLSKSDILNELKKDILELKLKPGIIISEATLSQRYQLSRTPIRDILKQLAQDGYIDIYPQRGSKVSFIDLKSVEQVTYLRSTLEKEILKDLSENISPERLKNINDILIDQKQVLKKDNFFDEFMELDDRFHKELFIGANRLFLWELVQKLNVHYVRYRKLHMSEKNKIEQLFEDHSQIVKFLELGDFPKIESIVKKHIRDDINSVYFKEHFSEYIC